AEPWVLSSPSPDLKWFVLGGLQILALLGTIVSVYWTAPTLDRVALEVDQRFDLKERMITAFVLPTEFQSTSVGEALLADATAAANRIRVADKFPVQPRRHAAWIPFLAGLIALTVLFYKPDTASVFGAGASNPEAKKDDGVTPNATAKKVNNTPFVKPKPPELDRPNKSKDLEKLEQELAKLAEKWAKQEADTPEKKREKLSELTSMEDKMKKFQQEREDKLAQLGKQLQQLEKLNKDKDFAEGIGKELNDALSKGEMKRAEDAVDELKKKAKDKKLKEEDLKTLEKQMEKMRDQLNRRNEDKEKEQKLKDMIDKAKKEGQNADALERELDKLKQDMKQSEQAMEKMAERMQKMQEAMKKGDMEELSKELDKLGEDLKEMGDELKDLEDVGEYLQKIQDEMKKNKRGQGDGDDEDEMNNGENRGNGNRGIGAGEREIDRDVKTESQEERIRGQFNPLGKKQYGGTTKGPAYTKKSEAEFGKSIPQAVQEAPQAMETQRLPRDVQQSVREYFEKLGGTEKK
ncbi:MAG: hypothetical protein ACRCZF_08505, partial [Gemmataceae bacterium]